MKLFGKNKFYLIGAAVRFVEQNYYVDEYQGQLLAELALSTPVSFDFTVYVSIASISISSESCIITVYIAKYHISRNIGEHYIWWFAQKTLLAGLNLAEDVITAYRKTHACSINGLVMA